MNNNLKSHFLYDSKKRSGILVLVGGILAGIAFFYFYPDEEVVQISEEEKQLVAIWQAQVDSLKAIEVENRKPKIFPFNPTLLKDYTGYQLGMSTEEIDRVVRFRESGKWFNSTAQFQQVSGVSDSLLTIIEPYFKWPKWLEEQRRNPQKKTNKRTWKTAEEKGKLNSLTFEQLMQLEDMDEESATKILRHQSQVGGYLVDQQVYDVYGVSVKLKREVLNHYTVKIKPEVEKLNVNTATASDLATIPLLNFDLAKEIVDYRLLREGIQSLDELSNLDGMTDYKFQRITLYLKIE